MTVLNIRDASAGWERDTRYQYVGRAGYGHDGYFGNPIRRGDTCGECGAVHSLPTDTLPCYRAYLARRLTEDPEFWRRVMALPEFLVCFCRPRPCHGDDLEAAKLRLLAKAAGDAIRGRM